MTQTATLRDRLRQPGMVIAPGAYDALTAMLVEQASGGASTGRRRVMDVQPESLHQRIGFVFGSSEEVERIEEYHRDEPLDNRARQFPLAFAVVTNSVDHVASARVGMFDETPVNWPVPASCRSPREAG